MLMGINAVHTNRITRKPKYVQGLKALCVLLICRSTIR